MPYGEAPTPLEERLNTISSKLTELEDLQLVDKLDIINLKNEIEKLQLTTSVPDPETLERIRELGKLAEHLEEFKRLKELAGKMDKLMAEVRKMKPEGIEDMIRVVDDIDKRVRKIETQGPGIKPGEAREYAKRIEELRSSLEDLPSGARGIAGLSGQLERLRIMVEENAKNILKLSRVRAGPGIKKEYARVEVAEKPEIVRCPRCKATLPPHARFCRRCGTKLK